MNYIAITSEFIFWNLQEQCLKGRAPFNLFSCLKMVKLKSERKIKQKMLAPLTYEAEKSRIVYTYDFENIYWTKWSSYLSLDRNKMNDTKYGYLFSVAKFSNSFEIICQSSRCAASFGNHLSPTTTSILATKDRKLYHFVHRGQGTYGKSVVCNNVRVSNDNISECMKTWSIIIV